METKDLQKQVIEFLDKWDNKRKTKASEQATFIHLVEEIGELARQYVNKESRKTQYNEKEIENSIGDIFIQLVRLANLRGLDIENVVLKIMEEEKKLFKN